MLYHSARGSETYTIVGNPTIVDGVVSGFSTSDYLQINSQAIAPDTLEFAGKFTMGPNGEGGFIFHNFSVSNGIGLAVRPTSSSNQGMLLYAGTSHYVFYTHRFEAGTTHTYKVLYNKSAGICYLYVDDELRRTLDTSEYTVYFGDALFIGRYGTDWFGGSIDLNETYIKVNGQPLFGICPIEVKKHQIMGPVGYTVVGSPTITDGVMSDISNDNYAYTLTNSTMYQSIVSFETVIKFTTGTSAPTGNLFGWQTGHGGAYINNSHRIRCLAIDFKEKKYRDYLTSFSALQANKTYYFKYEFRNNQGYCSLKEEGGEWQTEQIETGVNNFNQPSNYNYFYGRSNQASGYLTGGANIDFNNTYIKVNGKLWFWQPQETKRIVVNGVEVWTKPE